MLKIIRKYQLIILAIGGSLLMVVFLFQPILGKLSPDPRKSAVIKLADGTSFTGFDFQQASFDLAILKRVAPILLFPENQGGLGIETGQGDASELHWLLLSKQAKEAGLIGDAGEGRTWIPHLAQMNAMVQLQQQAQQGLVSFQNQNEFLMAVTQLAPQFEGPIARNVAVATGMMRGATEDDVYRTLATARGIDRLFTMIKTLPAFSDLGAMHAAKDRFDAVAIDGVLIKADMFTDAIPVPSDDELQAFFDIYKADAPADNDFRIGYTQPARVKLGWLTLNKQLLESTVVIDRVELNKIWRTDHALPDGQRKYPGDFAGERLNIESAYRAQRAFDIMFEADRIIRSQVLQSTRGFSKDGNFLILPEDWDTKRPTLEAMAQSVVDGLKEQLKVTIALPTVNIQTDRWLTSRDIGSLPGFGQAAYRIGSRSLPSVLLPQASGSDEAADLLLVQAGVPVVNPAAEDELGNRYYAVIYEINPAGPADAIDDVGRDIVLNDYRTIRAYEMLEEDIDLWIAVASREDDLAPAIDAAMSLGGTDITRPGVARNLLVQTQGIAPGRTALFVEPGLNAEAFRDAVIEAASGLNELATPTMVSQSPIVVATAIPYSKSIGLGKVIAPRPMTADDYRANITGIINNESRAEISEVLSNVELSPFSLEAISERYGSSRVKKRKGDDNEKSPEPETEEAEG